MPHLIVALKLLLLYFKSCTTLSDCLQWQNPNLDLNHVQKRSRAQNIIINFTKYKHTTGDLKKC